MKRVGFKRRVCLDAANYSQPNRARNKAALRAGCSLKSGGALKPKRRTKEETEWILAVRERDDYACRWPGCGHYSKSIHAHHVHTRAQRPDLKLVVENGACLCDFHHDKLHHSVEGRRKGRELGLLGTETYEKAKRAA